ncbi:MAG: DNA polymerase/3'-5' exonuclease PolX [Actinomycetota bacterium]|nr:DNA polymerase/3'-5' exonuclease PolX [Actinomycetota bacterium]
MAKANERVAEAFEELADLLQIAEGDRFKILAYRRVAAEIRALSRDITTLDQKELARLSGVGKATASKIREVIETGTMAKLEQARAAVPRGIREMTALRGLGPKRAMALNLALGISNLEQLEAAINKEKLRSVRGFGPKTEANLLASLKRMAEASRRLSLGVALPAAERLVEELEASPAVSSAAYCGSLRRMKETVGDLDLLAAGRDPAAATKLFPTLSGIEEVKIHGPTKTSARIREGLQVDLRVVAPDEFGAALQYFTGSQAHNVRVREIAVKQGFKLSEYGLFTVKGNHKVAGATEREVYEALGMQLPPPPMRENRGEIELSLKHALPPLVQRSELEGDLHCHSLYSDGKGSVREMALTARSLGHRYLTITDHFHAGHVRSNTPETLARQAREIAEVNEELRGTITILQGVEADIDKDGDLNLPDEVIELADVIVASIHSFFELPVGDMTRRMIRAVSNPDVNVLGHPTGRWFGSRPEVEVDLAPVFEAAARNMVALEVNSNPNRLDLKDDHLRLAKQYGCRFCINTDAHSPEQLSRIRLGVGMAQRGWVSPEEVVNCRPLPELRAFLAKSIA